MLECISRLMYKEKRKVNNIKRRNQRIFKMSEGSMTEWIKNIRMHFKINVKKKKNNNQNQNIIKEKEKCEMNRKLSSD